MRIHSRKGMTLFEIVVSLLIVSLMSTALAAIISQSLKGWSSGTSKEAANNAATIALQQLTYDIRNGRSAIATTSGLYVVFPLLKTDPSTGEQVYDQSINDPATHCYYVNTSTHCLMKSVGGVTTVLAHNVSSAVFGASGSRVTVTLTSTQQLGYGTETQNVTGYISLRNH